MGGIGVREGPWGQWGHCGPPPQFCQLGNFSIHVALRNLRPAGKGGHRWGGGGQGDMGGGTANGGGGTLRTRSGGDIK